MSATNAPLMVTISGVRGIAGASLTPAVVSKYVLAFGVLQKGKKIVIGRDSRVSGRWIMPFVQGLLASQGYDVVDLGIVPTPTVQYMTMHLKADGGLIVTSSHNPAEWNGLKFVQSDGLFLSPDKCKELFAIADKGEFQFPSYEHTGHVHIEPNGAQEHIDAIMKLPYINVDKIRQKKYKVVLDSVNGAGGPIMKKLLEHMGCQVIGLNLEPTGLFAHKPEPVPDNLKQLCEAVKEHKADMGIAVDPDVDRCVLIDETGAPLGEEYTLVFAVEFILGTVGKRGPVCKNLSSSRAVDDVAAKYGCKVYAAPVGEINVANKMQEVGAVIGGEGNGGAMLPDIHIGRDAPVAAALALQLLSGFNGTISQFKATLPQYEICKISAPIAGIDPDAVVAYIKSKWEGKARLEESDGLRIDTDDWWVHLRKSNTEPIIRVIGEGGPFQKSLERCNEFMKEITSYGKTETA
jgi:phosphomannomutase